MARLPVTVAPRPRKPQPSERDVASARQLFFECGKLPVANLHPRVVASWQRCQSRGLDAERPLQPSPLPSPALKEAQAGAEVLRLLAEPEMEFLTETLVDTSSQVVLSDARGLILDTRGDRRAMDRATREALLPGVSWSEHHMGTNAIGTALADNHLVEIWGAEHYHRQHKHICCTAAPILDHTGAIVGLLDVSGDARLPRGYARSLIKRSVREIEHRWLLNASRRLSRLSLHPTHACIGSYQEGILLLDDDRIVGANRSALRWLQADWTLVGRCLHGLFDLNAAPRDLSILKLHDGTRLHGSLLVPAQVSTRASTTAEPVERPLGQAVVPVVASRGSGCEGGAGRWLSETQRHELERARRAIDAGLSVVVLGETGCGKEVFVRLAHARSARVNGPLVAINCAALPENLIEAELFGYSEGAFTGASRKGARGRILEANGGVLFLDEIGDMPLSLQARLLRVLQDRQVTPLGGGRSHPVDCVVVSATHRDLAQLVEAGAFRADLYYRLRDHEVLLSPFRALSQVERRNAIDWLWQASGGPAKGMSLSDETLQVLLGHTWPGNLRELDSVLRTAIALGEQGECLAPSALPRGIACSRDPDAVAPPSLQELHDEAILEAVQRHGGKVAAAARELGIHRATLYRRLRQLGRSSVA